MARSRGSGGIRHRLQYRHTVRTRILTSITIGPSLTGLRGTQLTGSIIYTLVSWCLLEPSSAFMVIVWDNLVWGNTDFEECFVALRMISVHFPLENCFELHMDDSIYWFNYVIFVESVSTSESMIPRPCFQALHTVSFQFCYMFARIDIYFRLHLLLIIITTTCISLSLR
jgi:hypothetical protein